MINKHEQEEIKIAKISPVSIKYIVHAKFESEGAVEKPDVIGAVFGQTEGLLGDELEMRELQKEGKIGRIDVELNYENGKTHGIIDLPSALDKAETTIIAAALETIERIGPSDAKIEIEKIEDVRGNKREYIIERAKKLLEKIEGMGETREMEDAVKLSSRLDKLKEYGADNLPCGDISGEEVIVVEGRADVVTMLKAGVKNVIAMNGTILPETIKNLSLEKEITLFVDGDRGGMLIAKNAIDNARVDFVATAPDGKEVEELMKKEILAALRKKIPVAEFKSNREERQRGRRTEERGRYQRTDREERAERRDEEEKPVEKKEKAKKLSEKEFEKAREVMDDLAGTKGAALLDEEMNVTKKVSLSQLYNLRIKKIYSIVMDGAATVPIIKAIERTECKHLIARNFSFTDTYIDLVSL